MINDFHPDIIIGSVVSSNPGKPTEGDIMSQLENMVMQKTDYSLPDSLGLLMTFKYTDVSLMDFDKYETLHDNGYRKTMQLMDSIKSRISRRVDYRVLERNRNVFKKKMPEFYFKDIHITGATEQQAKYIQNVFYSSGDSIFDLEELRKRYFQLMSDNMISEVIPHAVYNSGNHTFDLNMKVKIEDELTLKIGGNVGSNGANQIYLGATYQNLNNYAKEIAIDGQLGQIYNNVQLSARLDLSTQLPTSFRMVGSISSFDYFRQEKLLRRRLHRFSIKSMRNT